MLSQAIVDGVGDGNINSNGEDLSKYLEKQLAFRLPWLSNQCCCHPSIVCLLSLCDGPLGDNLDNGAQTCDTHCDPCHEIDKW